MPRICEKCSFKSITKSYSAESAELSNSVSWMCPCDPLVWKVGDVQTAFLNQILQMKIYFKGTRECWSAHFPHTRDVWGGTQKNPACFPIPVFYIGLASSVFVSRIFFDNLGHAYLWKNVSLFGYLWPSSSECTTSEIGFCALCSWTLWRVQHKIGIH